MPEESSSLLKHTLCNYIIVHAQEGETIAKWSILVAGLSATSPCLSSCNLCMSIHITHADNVSTRQVEIAQYNIPPCTPTKACEV